MSVVIDCRSAARLIAEGAVCYDSDTHIATCDGLAVSLDSVVTERTRPVLVCGTSETDTIAMVDRLELLGVAAWRVLSDDQQAASGRECCGASDLGELALSLAE